MASHWVVMKQLGLLVIYIAVGTTLSGCISPRPTQSAVSTEEAEKIAEEITRISEPWGTTVLTKDTAYLKSLWTDDFSYIGADGKVRDEKPTSLFTRMIPTPTPVRPIPPSMYAYTARTLRSRMGIIMSQARTKTANRSEKHGDGQLSG